MTRGFSMSGRVVVECLKGLDGATDDRLLFLSTFLLSHYRVAKNRTGAAHVTACIKNEYLGH